jgi:hypothetical protein
VKLQPIYSKEMSPRYYCIILSEQEAGRVNLVGYEGRRIMGRKCNWLPERYESLWKQYRAPQVVTGRTYDPSPTDCISAVNNKQSIHKNKSYETTQNFRAERKLVL